MQLLQTAMPWIQVVLSVLLVGLILLQQGEGSLGAAFGGDGSMSGFRTKRGAEKVLFNITIAVFVLFVAAALLAIVLK